MLLRLAFWVKGRRVAAHFRLTLPVSELGVDSSLPHVFIEKPAGGCEQIARKMTNYSFCEAHAEAR